MMTKTTFSGKCQGMFLTFPSTWEGHTIAHTVFILNCSSNTLLLPQMMRQEMNHWLQMLVTALKILLEGAQTLYNTFSIIQTSVSDTLCISGVTQAWKKFSTWTLTRLVWLDLTTLCPGALKIPLVRVACSADSFLDLSNMFPGRVFSGNLSEEMTLQPVAVCSQDQS